MFSFYNQFFGTTSHTTFDYYTYCLIMKGSNLSLPRARLCEEKLPKKWEKRRRKELKITSGHLLNGRPGGNQLALAQRFVKTPLTFVRSQRLDSIHHIKNSFSNLHKRNM